MRLASQAALAQAFGITPRTVARGVARLRQRGEARPAVYYDPRSLTPSGPKGVLHAKAVICDNEQFLVTSANLTQAAMNRNIEVGILLRDRTIATTASIHFGGLIDQGLLCRLPDG